MPNGKDRPLDKWNNEYSLRFTLNVFCLTKFLALKLLFLILLSTFNRLNNDRAKVTAQPFNVESRTGNNNLIA